MGNPTVRLLFWLAICGFVADALTTGYGLLTETVRELNGNVAQVVEAWGIVPGLVAILAYKIAGSGSLVWMGAVLRKREIGFPLAEMGLGISAAVTWVVVGRNLAILVAA